MNKKKYIFFYFAPGGERRYHCDMFCTITDKAERAKQYESDPEEQKKIIRRNFNHTWRTNSERRSLPVWLGAKLKEITLGYEEVPKSQTSRS